jgi:ribosomal protein L11 methyltransferase
MNYIEVSIELDSVKEGYKDIVIADLGEIGYESFIEEDATLNAYIIVNDFNENLLEEVAQSYGQFVYNVREIEQQNWNAQWESSFDPIEIDQFCRIRAPFHESDNSFEYELVIEPKMSFGTGHHATTQLIIKFMKDIDFNNKSVLDMGCGTGILAIMAKKLGAGIVHGIDIDTWAVENTLENAERNNVDGLTAIAGDAKLITDMYDIIFANINRNILVNDMEKYADRLNNKGIIYFSGFYESDISIITESANNAGLTFKSKLLEDNWAALQFIK